MISAAIIAILVLCAGIAMVRWSRRPDPLAGRPRCPACEYDLSGGVLQCPECGHTVAISAELRVPKRRLGWTVFGWLIVAAGTAPLAMLGLVLALMLLDGSLWWTSHRIAESTSRGDQVIAAIEAFRADAGRFPKDLEELRPKYLANIPPPTAGNDAWRYGVQSGGASYELCFGANEGYYPCQYYEGPAGSWHRDE